MGRTSAAAASQQRTTPQAPVSSSSFVAFKCLKMVVVGGAVIALLSIATNIADAKMPHAQRRNSLLVTEIADDDDDSSSSSGSGRHSNFFTAGDLFSEDLAPAPRYTFKVLLSDGDIASLRTKKSTPLTMDGDNAQDTRNEYARRLASERKQLEASYRTMHGSTNPNDVFLKALPQRPEQQQTSRLAPTYLRDYKDCKHLTSDFGVLGEGILLLNNANQLRNQLALLIKSIDKGISYNGADNSDNSDNSDNDEQHRRHCNELVSAAHADGKTVVPVRDINELRGQLERALQSINSVARILRQMSGFTPTRSPFALTFFDKR